MTLNDIREALNDAADDLNYLNNAVELALKALGKREGSDILAVLSGIEELKKSRDEANALIGTIYKALKEPDTVLVLDSDLIRAIEDSTWGKANAIKKDVLK